MNLENNKRIAILILGYNSIAYLPKLLESLNNQTYTKFEIYYIDNASSDGSVDLIKNEHENIHIIQHDKNYGYAGGYGREMNLFFKSDFDAVVLLNPDIIVSKTWLEELVKSAYVRDDIGFAQSLIFINNKDKKKINSSGNVVHMAGFGLLENCGEAYKEDEFTEDRQCSYPSGCSVLIKREVFEKDILFDEDFFLYYEDQDLGWRGRMFGYDSIVSIKSHVWHDYEYPQTYKWKKKFFYLERNRWFFILKNYETKTIVLLMPYFCMWEIIVIAHSIYKGYFFYKIHAYFSFLKKMSKMIRKRKMIQLNRIKKDAELWEYISPSMQYTEIPKQYKKIVNYVGAMYYKVMSKFL